VAVMMVAGTVASIIDQPLILVYFAVVFLLFSGLNWNDR